MFYVPELQIDNGTHLNRYLTKPIPVKPKNRFFKALKGLLFTPIF